SHFSQCPAAVGHDEVTAGVEYDTMRPEKPSCAVCAVGESKSASNPSDCGHHPCGANSSNRAIARIRHINVAVGIRGDSSRQVKLRQSTHTIRAAAPSVPCEGGERVGCSKVGLGPRWQRQKVEADQK